MSHLVPRSCPTCSSIGPRRLVTVAGTGLPEIKTVLCPDPWHTPDGAGATAPEASLEPPRSAQQPPAGIPGSPNPAQGHTGPRAGRITRNPWAALDRLATRCGTTLAAAGVDPGDVAAWDYQAPSGDGRHTLALRLKNGQHVTLTGPDPDGGASVARTGPEPDREMTITLSPGAAQVMNAGAQQMAARIGLLVASQALADRTPHEHTWIWHQAPDASRAPMVGTCDCGAINFEHIATWAEDRIKTAVVLAEAEAEDARDGGLGLAAELGEVRAELQDRSQTCTRLAQLADGRAAELERMRSWLSEALDEAEDLGTRDEVGTERARLREIRREAEL